MSGEYVRRSDALQAVGDVHPLDYNGQGIVERIKAIPAADVVEVVRCWECRKGKWDPWSGAIWCEGKNRKPNFYCADGERKSGGQDDV